MYKLEKITWLDHCNYSSGGWRSKKQVEELRPIEVQLVGWVIKETKNRIVTVSAMCPEDDAYQREFCIVKSAVIKRKVLSND